MQRGRALPNGRPGMLGKLKPMTHLLREDFPEDRHAVTAPPCGYLWHVLSRPLIRHWAVYDGLMTLFVMVLLFVLFNNFV